MTTVNIDNYAGPGARIGRQYYGGKVSNDDVAIISHIVGEFINRSRQDIQDWRQNIDHADNPYLPRWAPFQDLLEYLRPDGHLGSQIAIRKGTVLSRRYFVRSRKTKEENEDKTALLQNEWFYNLLGDLLDCEYYVYTVAQLADPATGEPVGKYDLIPRRNFIPQQNVVLFEIFGATGVSIKDPAFDGLMVCVRSQEKLGILNDLIPDLIWKKNARQAWAEYGERFGMPMVTATTNKTNKKDLDRIEAMLKQLSGAARGLFPVGTVLDIKEGVGKGDPYKVYLEQIKYSDGSISKRILGGTMVSDDGSSRSQSEVHERTMNDIVAEADMKKMEFAVNGQVLPSKLGLYLGFTEDDEFCFDRSQDIDPAVLWTIIQGLLAMYEIPEKWISKKFNIPITGLKKVEAKPASDFFQ